MEYVRLMRIKFSRLCQVDKIGERLHYDEIFTKIDVVESGISLAVNLSLKYSPKMVDYLKKALIYGHTSRISS